MEKKIVMDEKIMVTPKEITNVEFSKGIKGYKEHDVDVFLDKVKETLEALLKENLELKETIKSKDELIDKQISEIEKYKSLEGTLTSTLITAQASATETCESANKKAFLIIEEAKEKADRMITSAELKVQAISREADRKIKAKQKEYENGLNRFETFKRNYIEMLNKELKSIGSYTLEGENNSIITE